MLPAVVNCQGSGERHWDVTLEKVHEVTSFGPSPKIRLSKSQRNPQSSSFLRLRQACIGNRERRGTCVRYCESVYINPNHVLLNLTKYFCLNIDRRLKRKPWAPGWVTCIQPTAPQQLGQNMKFVFLLVPGETLIIMFQEQQKYLVRFRKTV